MQSEVQKFQADLLASVKQMRRGQAAHVTKVKLPAAAEARASVGLSQQEFAQLLGVSARTLQDWEQGRREPTGAARTLLASATIGWLWGEACAMPWMTQAWDVRSS
ncbi:MAG: helix-turn-helix domain-containing protein [Methylibium sp.]|uniref:helix-turn-helix domain-containing protein n=1 Tax=Methylibium sp. TaxID=2067992 RepID=UPI001850E6BF|nr:helix-turn-helix domain-containing protein [Methylibium sp.]MBA3597928.1 helix-turn-helix domain-containing protein [Methylibium sp.]